MSLSVLVVPGPPLMLNKPSNQSLEMLKDFGLVCDVPAMCDVTYVYPTTLVNLIHWTLCQSQFLVTIATNFQFICNLF